MGFDKQQLLRQGGYEKGDVIILKGLGPGSRQVVSVSSSSFQFRPNVLVSRVRWDRYVPTNGTLVARMSADFIPGSGETVTARVRQASDGETVGKPLVVDSNTSAEQPFTKYSPTTTSQQTLTILQVKTEPGTNSSQIRDVSFDLGVRL